MLQTVANIGAIITPIITLVIAGIGWFIKQSIERKNKLEQDLRSERLRIYNEIINPFIFILSNSYIKNDNKNKNLSNIDIGIEKVMTIKYRENIFNMILFGSDGVVKSYNDLMQFFYTNSNNNEQNYKEILRLIGNFLLEIRKSTGNENTELNNIQMLESLITDIKSLRE